MAPADSLARLRKSLLDRAERKEAPVIQLCREAGISGSRFYELRARYRQYGEAGLRSQAAPGGTTRSAAARTAGRRDRGLCRGAPDVARPPLLLLDEPTATLDRVNAERIGRLLADLGATRAVLVATHDPALMAVAGGRLDLDARPVAAAG